VSILVFSLLEVSKNFFDPVFSSVICEMHPDLSFKELWILKCELEIALVILFCQWFLKKLDVLLIPIQTFFIFRFKHLSSFLLRFQNTEGMSRKIRLYKYSFYLFSKINLKVYFLDDYYSLGEPVGDCRNHSFLQEILE